MNEVREMLESSSVSIPVDAGLVARCIEACFDCEQSCVACADDASGRRTKTNSPESPAWPRTPSAPAR